MVRVIKMEQKLYSFIDKYKDLLLENNRLAVAVSGGMDSMALMLIADKWCKDNNIELIAITVDHQLREESNKEAQYVAKICEQNNIKHTILIWEGEKPQHNIELIARENRYKLISNFCKENDINTLLVAHHLQDQAETFFIRLFRGSGIDGLASMSDINNMYGLTILRPFLECCKEDLQTFLEEKQIQWVEDPSNNDEKYLRNKIRKFLNSFDNKQEILSRINSAVENINESKLSINSLIKNIEKKIVSYNSFGTCLLDKNKLMEQDDIVALKILSTISMKISGNIYKPRLKKLKRLFETIKKNEEIKYTFYGCVFETYKDNLIMIYREYNSILEDKRLIFGEEIIWDNRFIVKLNKQVDNVVITHIKDGEFKTLLNNTKLNNREKYKELREVRGIEKSIFHTLPIVKCGGEYVLDCEFVEIGLVK